MSPFRVITNILGAVWILPWTLVGVCLATGNARGLSWHPGLPAVVGVLETESWLLRSLYGRCYGSLVCGNVILVAESWYLCSSTIMAALEAEVRAQMLRGPFSVFRIAKNVLEQNKENK